MLGAGIVVVGVVVVVEYFLILFIFADIGAMVIL